MCINFQTKQTTLTFWAQICSKMDFGVGISKMDLESAPPIYHVCQFSVKMNDFKFFGLNLGKLPNYALFWFKYCWGWCRELGGDWNELGGGWNELGGGRWSWVEVGARFSNTHPLSWDRSSLMTPIRYLASLVTGSNRPYEYLLTLMK